MPTSVALGARFEDFVQTQVKNGRFNNVSEVVRAGLRLLEESEQRRELELAALRADINAGRKSGKGNDMATVFDRLEKKYAGKTKVS
jgi:antitoxin ParD1/3/4